MPYLRRLVVIFPLRSPRFELWSGHVGFVVDKVARGRFSPRTWVFHTYDSSGCSTFIIHHPEWYNRSNSGRRTKWIQYDPTPKNNKRKVFLHKIEAELLVSVLLFLYIFRTENVLSCLEAIGSFFSSFIQKLGENQFSILLDFLCSKYWK
jgi:hypothetical protein